MTLIKHTKNGQPAVSRRPDDLFETLFADWPTWFRRPFVVVPEGPQMVRADEYAEDGALVVRVEIGGIDPAKDVEISLEGDMLHIAAQRDEEEETKERDYTRRELRYGSFRRDLQVPPGTTEANVKASYVDGILEVRVPMAVEMPASPPTKIPVKTS